MEEVKGLRDELENDSEAKEKWTLDGESIVENAKACGVIYLAEKLLSLVDGVTMCPSALWWKIRVYFLHQNCLEEKSSVLWDSMKTLIDAFDSFLQHPSLSISTELAALFYTEMSQIYSYYYDIEWAKKHLSKAKELVYMETCTTGKC